jgi:peptidoglycan/LPS O-acetylase OafA/YrhL
MQHALKPPSDATNKLLGLEALRFLTAFAILVFHYQHFFYVADKPVGLVAERLPLYSLLHALYDAGRYGVWVFWCISGFIFFWKYRDTIADRAIDGWQFFTLRFSRLYPLHFVTLLFVALLQSVYFNLYGCFFVYQDNDIRYFLAQLLMASEWGGTPNFSFNGPIWSVSVEVLVYLLFFLILRVTRSWWLNVVVVVACLNAVLQDVVGQVIICLALFYVGGLAAAARQAVGASRYRTMIEACAWLGVAAIPPVVVYAAGDQFDRISFPLFLSYTPILLFCLSREIAVPSWMQAMIVAAGNMTYSSYLLHFPIQLVIMLCFAVAGRPVPVYGGALFAVYLLTTLLLSYVTFRFFEAPAQNLIRSTLRRADDPAQGALRRASSASAPQGSGPH